MTQPATLIYCASESKVSPKALIFLALVALGLPAGAQENSPLAGRIDSAKVEAVGAILAAVPDIVEAARRRVDARDVGGVDAPAASDIKRGITEQQLLLVRSAGQLMTQIEIGARASNAVLSAFNFGLNLGWAANPLSSPTMMNTYDQYMGRLLDFAPALAYGVSLRLTDNKGTQLNTLAVGLVATQLVKAIANRSNTQATKAQTALSSLSAVADYLDFNRMIFADSKRIANAAVTARSTDPQLAQDITSFMTKHGDFPLVLGDSAVRRNAEFTNYVKDAVPLIERFQQQIARAQDFYVMASGAVDTYAKHPMASAVTSDTVPATAKKLADDAKSTLASLRQSGSAAQADWNELRKLLTVTPSRVANLMQFYALQSLVTTVR